MLDTTERRAELATYFGCDAGIALLNALFFRPGPLPGTRVGHASYARHLVHLEMDAFVQR